MAYLDDGGQPLPRPALHQHNVAGAKPLERRPDRFGAVATEPLLLLVLRRSRALHELPVLGDIAALAGRVLAVAREEAFVAHDLPLLARHATVGEELREREVEQARGLLDGIRPQEVDGHVVRRPER